MPRLSCYLIRASLMYLIGGFVLGGLILLCKIEWLPKTFWVLLPIHIEFVLFGWTLQLAIGVAFWILPRFFAGGSRGNELLVWISFYSLNTGIFLTAIASIFLVPVFFPLLGRVLELISLISFVIHAWPRIKAVELVEHRQPKTIL